MAANIPPPSSIRKARLLFIEDDQVYAIMVSHMLTQLEFDFVHEKTLEAGLESLRSGGFDLVLLDLNLPESLGGETFDRLHQAFPEIPVVILTQIEDVRTALEIISQGGQDYLVKNQFEADILERVIRYSLIRAWMEKSLRESEERYRNFAADIAHELRTPLSTMSLHLDELKGDEDEKVINLRQDVQAMARLVEQLLALARLDNDVIGDQGETDLSKVCTNVAIKLAPIALKEKRTIEVVGAERPVMVRGGSDALEQALRNLVENAIKYSARETVVTIHVGADGSVKVIDQGQGIPKDKRDDIFKRFQRADRRSGGTGLGLSIVRRTVETFGGAIEVRDTPGGGATFVVNFAQAEN